MLQEPPVIFLGKHDMFSCFFCRGTGQFLCVVGFRNRFSEAVRQKHHRPNLEETNVFHNVGPPFDS